MSMEFVDAATVKDQHGLFVALVGGTNSGKAQPLDALVLTPTGFRKMGELSVGDLVTCPDGSFSRIVCVFPQGEKEIYRVAFSDGRTAECCDEHLWKVWRHQSIYETGKTHATRRIINGGASWAVASLKEIMSWTYKVRRAAVPLVEPYAIELPPQDLPVPPYALGALIGDGCLLAAAAAVSTADRFVLDRVLGDLPDYAASQSRTNPYDYRLTLKNPSEHLTRYQRDELSADRPDGRRDWSSVTWQDETRSLLEWAELTGIKPQTLNSRLNRRWPIEQALGFKERGGGARWTRSPLQIALQDIGLAGMKAHEKFVPDIYKRGSVAQRLALLQGLMDTDGSVGNGTHASFSSASERLARDVQEIAWSLGAKAKVAVRQTFYTYNGEKRAGRTSWRVSIVHPDVGLMFSLPRKVSACKRRTKDYGRLRIEKIEPAGRKQAQCIAIDHPSHLYVTNDYVVTHNTYSAMRMARGIAGPKGKIAVLDTEAGRTLHLRHEFAFNVLTMGPPHRPGRYLAAAQAAQDKGFDALVIDSFSQVWRGIGGVLDWSEEEASQMVERKKAIALERNYRFDESYERDKVKMASLIKPKYAHRLMVNGFLGLRIPIIFSIRGQMTVEPQEARVDENGRRQKAGPPKEVFKAYCESQFPFELTVSFRLSSEHKGVIDLSDPKSWKMEGSHKSIFKHGDQISEEHGAKLIAWARGSEVVQQQRTQAAREPERQPAREPEFEPAQQQPAPRRTLGQYLDECLAGCNTADDVERLEHEDPTVRNALAGPSADRVRAKLEGRYYALVSPPPEQPADELDAPMAAE